MIVTLRAADMEGPRFRALEEPFDQPAFRSAVARGLYGKNGIDGDGKCAMQELPASLEQVAFISYCVSPPCSLCSLVFLIGMHNLTSMAPPKAPCSLTRAVCYL